MQVIRPSDNQMGYKIREKTSGLFLDKNAKSLGEEGYEWDSRKKAVNVIRTKTRKKKNPCQYEIVETGVFADILNDPEVSEMLEAMEETETPEYDEVESEENEKPENPETTEGPAVNEKVLTAMIEQVNKEGPGAVATKPEIKKPVCFLMKNRSMKEKLDTYIAENPDRIAGFEIRTFDDLRLLENAIQYFPAEMVVLSEEVLPMKAEWNFGKSIRAVYYAKDINGLKCGAASGLKTIGTADSAEKLLEILQNEPHQVLFDEKMEEDPERLTIEQVRDFLITAKKIEQEIFFTKVAVRTEDQKIQDYLHYIEFNDIKPEEESDLICKIKKARVNRRKNKDINEVLEIAVNGVNREIMNDALNKLESFNCRIYSPRVENEMFEGSPVVLTCRLDGVPSFT